MASGIMAVRTIGMALVVRRWRQPAPRSPRPSGSEARTVEGTWYIQVTPIICATGAPVPGVAPVTRS